MQVEVSRTEKVARIFAAFDSDGDGLLCKVNLHTPQMSMLYNSIAYQGLLSCQ